MKIVDHGISGSTKKKEVADFATSCCLYIICILVTLCIV